MPVGGPAAEQLVLPARGRDAAELGADAADRRVVFRASVLRQPADGGGVGSESQTCGAADANHGAGNNLPAAQHFAASRGTQDLPVFTAEFGDRASRPGVVDRYH